MDEFVAVYTPEFFIRAIRAYVFPIGAVAFERLVLRFGRSSHSRGSLGTIG